MSNTPKLIPNVPCEMGKLVGAMIARFADSAQAKHPEMKERCSTCAFRLGTMPNGCLVTVANALKCSLEGDRFECHERAEPCAGWALLRADSDGTVKVPWDYVEGEIPASGPAHENPFAP